MKALRIKSASYDNRKKSLTIETAHGSLELPYGKLMLKPKSGNLITDIYVDKELDRRCVIYVLQSGKLDSVPVEAFLEFNSDPEYLREVELYKLTIKASELMAKSAISKRAICRQMGTSLSQLYRLLDTKNYSKSLDQMFKLLTILGAKVDIKVA